MKQLLWIAPAVLAFLTGQLAADTPHFFDGGLAYAFETPDPPQPPPPPLPGRTSPRANRMDRGGKAVYLGVGVAEIDSERAKVLKLREEHGVEVTMVEEDGPAAKAGIKAGDVVLEYNGQRVEGTAQFVRLVRETPSGRQVRLLVNRNGSTQTLTATLGERRLSGMHIPALGPEFSRDMEKLQENLQGLRWQMPDVPTGFMSWRSGMLGVEAEGLNPQLAEFFGVKEGVLVRSVVKDSPAEKGGLKAGDVITKIGETKVTSPREVGNALRSLSSRKNVPVHLIRNKQETTVSVSLDERPEHPQSSILTIRKIQL
jgi:serine protease Do